MKTRLPLNRGDYRLASVVACLSTSLLLVGLAPSSWAADESYGTIKGRLVWGGESAPVLPPLRAVGQATQDPAVCAAKSAIPDEKLVVDPKTLGVKEGLVYLLRPKGSNPEKEKKLLADAPKVVLDQKACMYVPHVIAIHKDQTLVLKSSDPVNHNVNIAGFNNASNDILPANSTIEKKLVVENPVINFGCNIHPWMSARVKVLDHPFFAITDKDGSFEITGVPPGVQNLVIWKEVFVLPQLGKGMPVTVTAGKVTDVGEVKVNPATFPK